MSIRENVFESMSVVKSKEAERRELLMKRKIWVAIHDTSTSKQKRAALISKRNLFFVLLSLSWASFYSIHAFAADEVSSVSTDGLIRTIWGCSVPCEVAGTHKTLKSIEVSYCSVSALSVAMIQDLSSVCRDKNGRSDAIAVRTSAASIATCDSSSNTCPQEGLTPAGFTCSVLCPSEDQFLHKYTACAKTGDEAWSFATQVCKDAMKPESSYFPVSKVCTVEGQTGC